MLLRRDANAVGHSAQALEEQTNDRTKTDSAPREDQNCVAQGLRRTQVPKGIESLISSGLRTSQRVFRRAMARIRRTAMEGSRRTRRRTSGRTGNPIYFCVDAVQDPDDVAATFRKHTFESITTIARLDLACILPLESL